jgi:hypothetical protein
LKQLAQPRDPYPDTCEDAELGQIGNGLVAMRYQRIANRRRQNCGEKARTEASKSGSDG